MHLKTLIAAAALAFAPLAAQAVTIDVDGSAAASGDTFAFAPFQVTEIEISSDADANPGTLIFNFDVTSGIKDLMVTASLNTDPLNPATLGQGFIDAAFEIRTGIDGDMDGLLDTLTGPLVQPDVSFGSPLMFANLIPAGDSFQVVARFAEIVGNGQNFDLRITAVPLPAPLALLLAGVAGLGLIARRKAA